MSSKDCVKWGHKTQVMRTFGTRGQDPSSLKGPEGTDGPSFVGCDRCVRTSQRQKLGFAFCSCQHLRTSDYLIGAQLVLSEQQIHAWTQVRKHPFSFFKRRYLKFLVCKRRWWDKILLSRKIWKIPLRKSYSYHIGSALFQQLEWFLGVWGSTSPGRHV